MTKRSLLGSAAALVLGFAGSALADVNVFVDVDKTKDISVTVDILIFKNVDITVTVDNSVTKAAEVDSLINQANFDNEACENCAEKIGQILDSVNGNAGIVTVNQASGNMNNQGSVLTAAVDFPRDDNGGGNGDGFFGYAEAQAAVDQLNGVDESRESQPNVVDSANILFREDHIVGSISDNLGIAMVNQAAGQMNNQANNIALAVSFDPFGGVALSEADLGQETSTNTNHESDTFKQAVMRDSVNGNKGVTLVNQGTGNMGNQANVLSFAAAAIGSSLVTP
jgi:hypothetical protein